MNIDTTEILLKYINGKEFNNFDEKSLKIGEFENLKIIKDICYLWNKEYKSKYKANSFAIFVKDDLKGDYVSVLPNEKKDLILSISEDNVFKYKNSAIKYIDSHGKNSVLIIFLKTLYDMPKKTTPIEIIDVNGQKLKIIKDTTLNDYDEAYYSFISLKYLKNNFYIFD